MPYRTSAKPVETYGPKERVKTRVLKQAYQHYENHLCTVTISAEDFDDLDHELVFDYGSNIRLDSDGSINLFTGWGQIIVRCAAPGEEPSYAAHYAPTRRMQLR